jgi:hypothetical protein
MNMVAQTRERFQLGASCAALSARAGSGYRRRRGCGRRPPQFIREISMRFGWLTLSLSPSPEEDAARIDQQIAQVCFAEQLGFSDLWLTEHYFTGESVYNDALLFAAAVAMRTERIRIGFAVVQLPFHHPVRLAVQLALLDNLSKGRIDVGVGKGTIYNEYEFVGHGCAAMTAASGWRRRSRFSGGCGTAAR